jgi:hypothetical protein
VCAVTVAGIVAGIASGKPPCGNLRYTTKNYQNYSNYLGYHSEVNPPIIYLELSHYIQNNGEIIEQIVSDYWWDNQVIYCVSNKTIKVPG